MIMELLSRRDREQARHRQEILAAAEQVFASKGFHIATMEEIASVSQFAIASLYKHFRSKDSIFKALMEEKLERYVSSIEALVSQPMPFEPLFGDFVNTYARFADDHRAFFLLLHKIHETAEWQRDDIKMCIRPLMDRYYQAVRRLVGQGVSEGALRAIEPEHVASFVMGTLNGFFFVSMASGAPTRFQELIPTIKSLLLQGAGTQSR